MRPVYTKALVSRAREMRDGQTPAERKLWHGFLRSLPLRVRRQCPMHGYIVDFYIHSHRLVIELDGASHDTPEAQAYDAERTRILEAARLQVVRFSNREVFREFGGVCGRIRELVQSNPPPASREPP